MLFREAHLADIPQLHLVRNAVKENVLTNPNLVTEKDYETYLNQKGKGWLCEIGKKVVGFSIVSLADKSVWALFVHPSFEGQGIGLQLHHLMLDWYFSNTQEKIWLSTEAGTKAEAFYRKNGWIETGRHNGIELKFEMRYQDWNKQRS